LIEQLEQLSLALSQISRDEAKRVADAVNNKILDLLDAQVIKLYWIGEAQDGVLLTPMAFINRTQSENPRPFQLREDNKGILPWVFKERRPLWLEELTTKDLNIEVRNRATGDPVPADHLDMGSTPWLDSMMVIPMTVRGDVRGLYSVELRSTGRLNRQILELLQRIARPLAAIFWDAEHYAYSEERTSNAVSQFVNVAGGSSPEDLTREGERRSGFIARPFTAEFSEIESRIASLLESKHIRARAYQPEGGNDYIIDEIQRQIKNSHFCIADVTGLNPNVMAEVGMIMILKKHFLLLRRRGDTAGRPFNLSALKLYDYEVRQDERGLQVWDASAERFQPFEDVLDKFIDQLPAETGYTSAREWTPDTD
jgi:GAF domain